ncbi:MAG: serine/threonine protein kinase [Candidatus Saccharibacteria bacterium]|nr:serine/threonine protein kinase [Microbacteriaceae bacterium]
MSTNSNRSSTAEFAAGDMVGGRFRIESVVGVGGMATVFRAVDESLGRTVALKVFRSELADADDVRRQRDEVQLLASLNAPGLVTLFDAVAEGGVGDHGRAFLVLEFVDGIDLRTKLLDGPPGAALIARIGSDVAGALSYIHRRGVVHRDVKPSNILLPHDHSTPGAPLAKLADFGIARLLDDARMTATGTVIGTATYLSPEQAQGAMVGTASDVYSLGLVLLEGLTGLRAFPGTAIEAVLARLAREPEIPLTIDDSWRTLLTAMTARQPQDRPDAASVAATLLEPSFLEASAPGTEQQETVLLSTEHLDPTKLLPTPDEYAPTMVLAATERLDPTVVLGPPTLNATPASPTTHSRRRRFAFIGAAAAVLLVVIVLALSLPRPGTTGPAESSTSPSPKPAASSVAYPDVSGPLGDHLRQLQRSVAP